MAVHSSRASGVQPRGKDPLPGGGLATDELADPAPQPAGLPGGGLQEPLQLRRLAPKLGLLVHELLPARDDLAGFVDLVGVVLDLLGQARVAAVGQSGASGPAAGRTSGAAASGLALGGAADRLQVPAGRDRRDLVLFGDLA